MRNAQSAKDIYKLVQDDYDHVDESFHESYDTTKELPDQLASFCARVPASGKVLDVGGTLAEIRYFLDKGFSVTNIDVSQRMLDYIARKRPLATNVAVSVTDYKGSGFQGVWACRSLIHIPPVDIARALRNMFDALEPKGALGTIFFTTEKPDLVEEQKPEWQTTKPGTIYYRVLYPAAKLQELIADAGFVIVKVEAIVDLDGDKGIYVEALKP